MRSFLSSVTRNNVTLQLPRSEVIRCDVAQSFASCHFLFFCTHVGAIKPHQHIQHKVYNFRHICSLWNNWEYEVWSKSKLSVKDYNRNHLEFTAFAWNWTLVTYVAMINTWKWEFQDFLYCVLLVTVKYYTVTWRLNTGNVQSEKHHRDDHC
jgi:hypothetical protein